MVLYVVVYTGILALKQEMKRLVSQHRLNRKTHKNMQKTKIVSF